MDLAKPKSGTPWLFILSACRVAALIMKSFSLLSSIDKFHCLTSEFHGTFYAKNRYRMNHEAMSTISVFRVKFTLEFTSLAINFS